MYEDEMAAFLLLWLGFIGMIVAFLFWAFWPAVETCVSERMEILEGTDFWSGERERAETVRAVRGFCEAVAG